VKDAELADPDGFLLGAVTPAVREPVGRLPSGRAVMPLGDTAIAMDPVGGQGANLGNKYARHLVAAVAAAPGATFDAGWMTATFEAFWADHGAATVTFNNLLLQPMTTAGVMMMISQYGSNGAGDSPSQRLADAVIENFSDPRRHTAAFLDRRVARELIASAAGRSWQRQLLGAALRVGGKQLGRLLGIEPKHPMAAVGREDE
jgi:hypothetical protein